MTIVLAFGVIALAAVAFYLLRRVEVERRERRLAESVLKDVRQAADTSYATGYGHGLDEGYRKAELFAEQARRKKLAQEQGRRISLN